MSSPDSLEPGRLAVLGDLGRRIGHQFSALSLLDAALRHRSWCGEHGGVPSNERLEFLGDAVLQLAITERLYDADPPLPEGVLAQRRAAVVNTRTLADAARRVELGSAIRLGRGEAATGGTDKDSILADSTEAIIGAVHLDAGFDAARFVIFTLLQPDLERARSRLETSATPSRFSRNGLHISWSPSPVTQSLSRAPGPIMPASSLPPCICAWATAMNGSSGAVGTAAPRKKPNRPPLRLHCSDWSTKGN